MIKVYSLVKEYWALWAKPSKPPNPVVNASIRKPEHVAAPRFSRPWKNSS